MALVRGATAPVALVLTIIAPRHIACDRVERGGKCDGRTHHHFFRAVHVRDGSLQVSGVGNILTSATSGPTDFLQTAC